MIVHYEFVYIFKCDSVSSIKPCSYHINEDIELYSKSLVVYQENTFKKRKNPTAFSVLVRREPSLKYS